MCVYVSTNVWFTAGVSRRGTAHLESIEIQKNVPRVRLERQATAPGQPFSAEDLERAMTAAAIHENNYDPLRNNMAITAH